MSLIEHILKNLHQLLTSKKLAATICVADIVLHLALATPAQLTELRAYSHQNIHYIDLIAIVALGTLIVSAVCHLHSRLARSRQKRTLYRAVIEVVDRVLSTPGSDKHKIILQLYHLPDTPLNYMAPPVKFLGSVGVICPTSNIATGDLSGIYKLPYNLTDAVRQYMDTHREKIPPLDTILTHPSHESRLAHLSSFPTSSNCSAADSSLPPCPNSSTSPTPAARLSSPAQTHPVLTEAASPPLMQK